MKDAQITVLFMMAAIAFTGLLLVRKQALNLKFFALAMIGMLIVGGFIFTTL